MRVAVESIAILLSSVPWLLLASLYINRVIAHLLSAVHQRLRVLAAGAAVGVAMPMTPESVAIYLGIILAGCAAVSIADSFAPSEIQSRLKISKAALIFTQVGITPGISSQCIVSQLVCSM